VILRRHDRTTHHVVAVALILVVLLAGCGDDDPAFNTTQSRNDELPAVYVEGTTFRDASGRQVLLRGYNARVEGIFDVTFDDGRIPLESIPPFVEDDAQRFEQLGLNVLRLPVNWSGLEPHPQQYSEAYMQRIDAVVALGRRHHFYVLIDMHQDAYSKEFGEDGAPLWAIVPPPPMLLQGPLTDLDSRRISAPVLRATGNFFSLSNKLATDGRPLQEAFVTAVQQLVKRYIGNPAVLGYEAFNEPITFTDPPLDAFHERFADGVHAIDPVAAIFFEPSALRNSNDLARVSDAPWATGPGVYAPHIYTTVFSPPNDSWTSEDPAALAPSMQAAAVEAQAWGTPLFVGEYGMDQCVACGYERGHRWLAAELDLQDHFLASSTVWVWRETGEWGLLDAAGAERPATARTVSRPYPRAVAGDLLAIERPAPEQLLVRYRETARSHGQAHEVSASPRYFTDVTVTCDGTPVPAEHFIGRVRFHCAGGTGERVFKVSGTLPGD
jgi:endoglycosylceramidase